MELTHVELSVAPGTLDSRFEADLDRLLHGVFGWVGATTVDDVPEPGPSKSRMYIVSSRVKLVLREQPIVDGARPNRRAIDRNDSPAASPREISSRSPSDNRSGDRFGSGFGGRFR